MAVSFPLREMIGGALADALEAAHVRTGDDTITVRCLHDLWSVERGGEVVAEGLSHDAAVEAVDAEA